MAHADLPPSVRAEYERIAEERIRAGEESDRLYRWELVRVCAELIGWTMLGLFVAGFAFAVTDFEIGMILLYGGITINMSGVAVTLWTAHRRGEARGDW